MKPTHCLVAVMVIATPVQNAQVDCADWNTEAFFEAAGGSDMTRCLQAGANPMARDEDGSTPLHSVAYGGRAEAIDALLKAGANLEAWTLNGSTPLHSAAIGTAEAVTALLEVDANLEAQNFKGETPLHLALYFLELEEHMIELELEIERGNRTTSRVTRVKELIKTVTSLLKAGAGRRPMMANFPSTMSKTASDLKERSTSPMFTGSCTKPGFHNWHRSGAPSAARHDHPPVLSEEHGRI